MGKGSTPHRARPARKLRGGLGHSRAGRPRKDGERYENGRLKPPPPNARVVAERRALLGEADAGRSRLKMAENPLDLILARGWLSREHYDAGRSFAALHGRARLSLPPIRTSSLETRVRAVVAAGDATALWRLNEIWTELDGEGRSALIEVCVLEVWPAWLVAAALTGDPAVREALLTGHRKRALERALDAVGRQLMQPAPAGLSAGSALSRFVEWVKAGKPPGIFDYK